METPTPIWKTPAFWRECAEEWRGPANENTRRGICLQLLCKLDAVEIFSAASDFLHEFDPTNGTQCYFFELGDRASRAALCDKIADHLEHENQTQGPGAQA